MVMRERRERTAGKISQGFTHNGCQRYTDINGGKHKRCYDSKRVTIVYRPKNEYISVRGIGDSVR